jgi:hypothetical protein
MMADLKKFIFRTIRFDLLMSLYPNCNFVVQIPLLLARSFVSKVLFIWIECFKLIYRLRVMESS